MSRNFEFSVGEYYHIYNRGTEKRNIFNSDYDRNRFLGLLYLCNNTESVHISNYQGSTLIDWLRLSRLKTIVDIGAYCLMPNHFHLLLREKSESGVGLFMQKISTAYTMYFNKKNDRTGSLFAGRYKAKHADRDEYLKYLISYIHLNPVKMINSKWKESGVQDIRKAKSFLEQYTFSSYFEFTKTKNRPESVIIDKQSLPEYFLIKNSFDETLKEWLTYKDIFSI